MYAQLLQKREYAREPAGSSKGGQFASTGGISGVHAEGFKKAVASVLKQGAADGFEHFSLIGSALGQEADYGTSGSKWSIEFSPTTRDILSRAADNSLVFVHNHPGETSLSMGDILVASRYPSMAYVVAVTPSGSLFWAKPKLGEYAKIHSSYLQIMQDTPQDPSGSSQHSNMLALAKLGLVEYGYKLSKK